MVLAVKNPPANAEDVGSISDLGRSPEIGNGNLLQYYCLRNPMDRGALAGYSPWGHRRVRHDLATKQQQNLYKHPHVPIYLLGINFF